jgi:hypothetical protein
MEEEEEEQGFLSVDSRARKPPVLEPDRMPNRYKCMVFLTTFASGNVYRLWDGGSQKGNQY